MCFAIALPTSSKGRWARRDRARQLHDRPRGCSQETLDVESGLAVAELQEHRERVSEDLPARRSAEEEPRSAERAARSGPETSVRKSIRQRDSLFEPRLGVLGVSEIDEAFTDADANDSFAMERLVRSSSSSGRAGARRGILLP